MNSRLKRKLSADYWRRKRRKVRRRATDHAYEAAVAALQPNDTCVDLGANIGDITAEMVASGATVHAFEPDPYAYSRLSERFGGRVNVVLVNAVAGLRNGQVQLYRTPGFADDPEMLSQSSSVFEDKLNVDSTTALLVTEVDVLRYLMEIGSDIAILKMDIEGAEVPILEKLLDHPVARRIALIFVETHETRIPSLTDRTNALRRGVRFLRHPRVYLDWR